MLSEDDIEKLLGRSLTDSESGNFDLYLDLATQKLGDLLCTDIEIGDGSVTPYERSYAVRPGYRTVFTDVFTGEVVVTVDGVVQDESTYTVKQFDKLNGEWFNSIVFDEALEEDIEQIEVSAFWGFIALPADLQLLLAKLFDLNTKEQTEDTRVTAKKVEDFSVTLKGTSGLAELVENNAAVIRKYSICSQGVVAHGPIPTIC